MLKKLKRPHLNLKPRIHRWKLSSASGKRARFLFLIVFSSIQLHLTAQEDDILLWMNYAVKVPVNEKLSWGGDVGARALGTSFDLSQMLVRPALTYKIKETTSISGAVAWFGSFAQGRYSSGELRFHQELNAEWPHLNPLYFFYRVRIEERFFFYKNDLPNAFRVRLRGLMGVQTRDLTWFGSKRPIYFQTIVEGFKTLADEEALEVFINQARFHLAFGHRISRRFRYEIHYIHQGSNLLTSGGLETTQNIFRIRLFHQL